MTATQTFEWLRATTQSVRKTNETAKASWCAIRVPAAIYPEVAACDWLARLCKLDFILLLRGA